MIIEDQVRNTIRNFEPRVGDIGVEVNAVLMDNNTLEVKVLLRLWIGCSNSIIHLFIRTNEIICPLHSLQI